MPEETKKVQELVVPAQESNEDLDTFANRKIAELTAKVTTLKEYFQSQKSEVPDGENFDQEITQIEQIRADFEMSVREILQTEEEHLPREQKKGVIETLATESKGHITDLEKQAGFASTEKNEKDISLPEPEAYEGVTEINSPEYYNREAEKSARVAMSEVKDKKTAQFIRKKYDDFFDFCSQTAVDSKLDDKAKANLLEQNYQQFLDQITSLAESEPGSIETIVPEKEEDASAEKVIEDLPEDFKAYEARSHESVLAAMRNAKDTKTAQELRIRYDNFLAAYSELSSDGKIDNEKRLAEIEKKYQEFLAEIAEIMKEEQIVEQEDKVVEVSIQEAKPVERKSVSLDDLEVVAPVAENKPAGAETPRAETFEDQKNLLKDTVRSYMDEAISDVEALRSKFEISGSSDKAESLSQSLQTLKDKLEQIIEDDALSYGRRAATIEVIISEFYQEIKAIEKSAEKVDGDKIEGDDEGAKKETKENDLDKKINSARNLEELIETLGADKELSLDLYEFSEGTRSIDKLPENVRAKAEQLLKEEIEAQGWRELWDGSQKMEKNTISILGAGVKSKKPPTEQSISMLEARKDRSALLLEASFRKMPEDEIERMIGVLTRNLAFWQRQADKAETDPAKNRYINEGLALAKMRLERAEVAAAERGFSAEKKSKESESSEDFEKGAKEKLVEAEAKVDLLKTKIKDNEHKDEITKELDEFLAALKNDKDRVANYPELSFEQREGWFDGLIEQFNNRLKIIETNAIDRETAGLEEAVENNKSGLKDVIDSLKLQLEAKENKKEISAELDRILSSFSQNADKIVQSFGFSPAEKVLKLTYLSTDIKKELQALIKKEALSVPEGATEVGEENLEAIKDKLEEFAEAQIDILEPEVKALLARLSGQEGGEEKIADISNTADILAAKIGQIIENDTLSFDQRKKEIEISIQEFREKLKVIAEGLPEVADTEEADKSGKKKNKLKEGLGKFGKGFREAMKTKQGRMALTKAAYDLAGSVLGFKFVTDVALATTGRGDIYNYVKQKKEVRKEKKNIRESLVKDEKTKVKEIIEASTNISAEEKKDLFARLEALDYQYQGADEKLQKEKQARVNETLNVYIQNKVKGARIAKDALNTALMAAHLSVFRVGAFVLGSMAERTQQAANIHDKERLSSEGTATIEGEEKKEQEAKMHFVLRDLVVNSTRETVRSLKGKGKTADSKHKEIDRIQALAKLATVLGIGSAVIHAEDFSVSIDRLQDIFEKGNAADIAKGLGSNALESFVENADRVLPGSFSSDDKGQTELATEINKLVQAEMSPEQADSPTYSAIINLFKANPQRFGISGMSDEQIANLGNEDIMSLIREKGDIKALTDSLNVGDFNAQNPDSNATIAKALEDSTRAELIHKMLADPEKYGYTGPRVPEQVSSWVQDKTSAMSVDSLAAVVKDPEKAADVLANLKAEEPQLSSFKDVIDSSKLEGGSDSIWRSTRNIFESHAKELGYKGEPDDQEALSKWAETQTANLVGELSKEQGGNLADLVHDGDEVSVEIVDGKQHLSFEASSGIEAGHLEDTNIENFVGEHNFGDNVEHHLAVDESTGDQYIEIKSGDDIYKVYDWDRDGEPDLVFPDGHHQEMSSEELTKFFEEKNILGPSEAALQELSNNANEAVEATNQATLDKINAFVNKGEGTYSQDMFAAAKEKGQLDQIFRHILASNDRRQASSFVSDYFRDQGLTDNKKDIFLSELNHILGTEDGRNYAGTTKDMLRSFDENVITNFKALDQHFNENGDSDWTAVHVGDTYALVQKHGGGLFGKARFFIDTNGDGEPDSIKPNIKAMQEAFEGKRPIGYEGKMPEQVAPAPDEKTFSLKRPEVPATDKAPEVASAPVFGPELPPNIENVEVPMSPTLSLAIESLNRGDASLDFDVSKLETVDLDYLNKVKINCEAMIVVLKDSKEAGAIQLRDGYKEVLGLINNQIEKAGSMDKAA